MLLKRAEFLLEAAVAGWAVPAVSVLRDDSQHHLLAAAADRDWRMRLLHRFGTVVRLFDRMVAALEGSALLGEQQLHDMKPLVGLPQPRADFRKFVAVTPELLVHPARADADFEAAVA